MTDVNMYDLIYVKFNDVRLQARPIEFSYDKDKNPLNPSKYITTCPNCGCLCEIFIDGILETDIQVGCQGCSYGLDKCSTIETVDIIQKEAKNEIVVNKSGFKKNSNDFGGVNFAIETEKRSIIIDDNNSLSSGCPFIDPIEMGTFKVDE